MKLLILFVICLRNSLNWKKVLCPAPAIHTFCKVIIVYQKIFKHITIIVVMDNHKDIILGISKQLKEILDSSEQAMYIYLDDTNKVCNEKFASMLGYKSKEEWANVKTSFPEAFVSEKSQKYLIESFRRAMEKNVGSNIKITWKKKSGDLVDTNVILVPIAYEDHLMALHFIS